MGLEIWGTLGEDKSGQAGSIDLPIRQDISGCPLCAQDCALLPASAAKEGSV